MTYIDDHIAIVQSLPVWEISQIAKVVCNMLAMGGTLYTCGNGGSASDALHLAAELVGRFEKERKALKAVCLNANVSDLTAIANDYGYDQVFARPLQVCTPRDVVIGFTTSGNSANVISAFCQAKSNGATTIVFTGCNPNAKIYPVSDIIFGVSSQRTSHIQECHIIAIHMLAQMVEDDQVRIQQK